MRLQLLVLLMSAAGFGQSISAGSGAVRGTVVDPSGAVIPGATVEIQNAVSQFAKTVKADSQGRFELDNIPYNNYHLSASAPGFQRTDQDVNVRSPLPLDLKISVKLGQQSASVTVAEAGDLLEADPTAHTDIDRALFDKLPLESASSSLSALVTMATPGVAADSNGLFHGLGDHASNSFSVDGQPITDQQSKVFSNQIPVDSVQSMEVIEGAPPAEYGGKTSLVVVVTTRSGLGVTQPHGDVTASYGTFGSANGGVNLEYGGQKWGNFVSLSGLDTGRFLDGPEFQTLHGRGNQQNGFDRLDFKPSDADTINLNLGFTRSWFQTPNSYDSQSVGQDERSQIRTFNVAPTFTHLINPNSVLTFGAFVRQDRYNYYPDGQDRSLKNAGARLNYSYVAHNHNIKIGSTYTHTFLTERDFSGPIDTAFYGHTDIKELAVFAQDTVTVRNWTFNLGVRFDKYNGITRAAQAEPRLGIAYKIKPSNTVLRVSYARTMETPFNENLILASSESPLRPGHRNEFHAGLQQAFGKYLVVDGEYIWKYTNRAFDFSVFGNSPITYPIEWQSSKIPGYAIRASVPNFHGLSALVVMSSVAARFFGPQVAGIGAGPGGSSVFRIDHDEKFNQTTHLQYQPRKTGPWVSFNWRYDSGLVAGPAPCAGGNCNNGPNGTDTVVDVSGLTPDQQFQAGLSCAGVFATPLTPISATGLCSASQYASKFLSIPAAGTEDDDHNPPRVASRNLFDLAVGHDNVFHGDRYKWSARVTVVNLLDKEALYNFISTFSGTHYVTPRAVTATVGFHF